MRNTVPLRASSVEVIAKRRPVAGTYPDPVHTSQNSSNESADETNKVDVGEGEVAKCQYTIGGGGGGDV